MLKGSQSNFLSKNLTVLLIKDIGLKKVEYVVIPKLSQLFLYFFEVRQITSKSENDWRLFNKAKSEARPNALKIIYVRNTAPVKFWIKLKQWKWYHKMCLVLHTIILYYPLEKTFLLMRLLRTKNKYYVRCLSMSILYYFGIYIPTYNFITLTNFL